MFYHNLIIIIINKCHIFVKLSSPSFIWCNSYDAFCTHEWLKTIWREETKKQETKEEPEHNNKGLGNIVQMR